MATSQKLRADYIWGAISGASAALLLFALNSRNAVVPSTALAPVVIFAALGLATRWVWPPIVVIVWTTLLQVRLEGHPAGVIAAYGDAGLIDIGIAFLVLAYTAAHYRFVSIRPQSPQISRASGKSGVALSFVDSEQVDWLSWVASLAAWPVVGMVLWSLLPADRNAMEAMQISADLLLLLAATWLFGGLALIVRAILATIDAQTMTPSEARAMLADTLYHEMRADLNRIAARVNRDNLGE